MKEKVISKKLIAQITMNSYVTVSIPVGATRICSKRLFVRYISRHGGKN